MLSSLRTSIVVRSSAIVLAITLFVGGIFAAFTYFWESNTERELVKNRMNSLLSTVENTVSIACYLFDANLAKEVAQGLLSNQDVASVKIYSEQQTLAALSKNKSVQEKGLLRLDDKSKLFIQRPLYSPFNPNELVCQIELTPDLIFIRGQINNKARITAYLLLLQALIMAGAVVYVVTYKITRPIKTISDRLHRLPPNANASLSLPAGNEHDEIGQLVRDVNTLFSKLFNLLEDERELRIRHQIGEKKFQAIFENSETGIFLLKPDGEVISSNPAYLRLFAIPLDADPSKIKHSLVNNLNEYALRLQSMLENASYAEQVASEDFMIEVGTSSQKKWINLVLSAVENGILQGLVNDITERKQIEESATQLAVTDYLTGIANRLGFEKAMARIHFEMHGGLINSFYLLMIDLDGFKEVNDQLGHEIGDKVLCHFSQLLTKIVRKSDFIARIGGDEFVVVLKDIDQLDKVQSIAEKITSSAAKVIIFENTTAIQIGASVGIAFASTPDFEQSTILAQADEAMYVAKKSGKNQYHIYSPS
ncbi:diguanylate cyclase domain-containing protein [Undibacterium sp. Di24W]|uniref:sensor domain-containing diguanylate cyclase n=1 Tax=Undibacterium sp. Di24W TaxID=3413033 RepID=UPI003BF15AFF